MRVKGKKLEWYELYYNWNEHQVMPFNIFRSDYIPDLYKEYKKKKIKSKEDVKQFTERYLRTYWSRVEYEIMVGDVGCKFGELEKVDVFRQAIYNIDRIVDYVISELQIKF